MTWINHESKTRYTPMGVWFTGSTELKKGMGVCFDRDRGTATDYVPERLTYVELPSETNVREFAGVVVKDYPAIAGGQQIEIALPGSCIPIAIRKDVTIGDYVTCSAGEGDGGYWSDVGYPGEGTARVLETISDAIISSDWTGDTALDATGKIMTDSDATFSTDGVQAGDKVAILGVEDDDTNSGTPGIYTVSSVDSETQITLTTAASDGGTMVVGAYYIFRGNPTVMAELMMGQPSGLVHSVLPPNTGHATDDTFVTSPIGKTNILGGVTIGTANARETLPDAEIAGEKKLIECKGALTTNDAEIKLATSSFQYGLTTLAGPRIALVDVTFDAADETIELEWNPNGYWLETASSGCAKSSS